MLEALSPLGFDARFERDGISFREDADFTLTQLSGEDKALKKALGKLPTKVGLVLEHDERSMFRIAPQQIWLLGEPVPASENLYITPLSSGRTRILLEGLRARDVLSSVALIDFHLTKFKPGHFVMSGIHHTPATIVCIGDNRFHLYVLRTFALNVWEWLFDIAEGMNDARHPQP